MSTFELQLDLLDELATIQQKEDAPPWPTRQDGLRLDQRPEWYDEAAARFIGGVRAHQGEHGWRWYYGWRAWGYDSNGLSPHPWIMYRAEIDDLTLIQALVAERERLRETCQNVRSELYRAWCVTCETWGDIRESTVEAIGAHLDDHYPGWGSLPLLCPGGNPGDLRWNPPQDYPTEWISEGLPYRECRHHKYGLRGHLRRPDESPWKGTPMFCVGVLNPDCKHYKEML